MLTCMLTGPSVSNRQTIVVLDNARKFKVDIQGAIERKHAYNATRAFRHGGKLS